MSLVPTTDTNVVHIDQTAVLKAIGLNPTDPKSQAVVLVCDRYGLDPVLKHVILIQGAVYVTRDGLLHIAHSSGQFDGIEVVGEDETASHWTARVSVYRKDMTRPITYSGRYPKTGSNKAHGPEMAIARAESMALRRAFAVAGIPSRDEVFDPDTAVEETGELAPEDLRHDLRVALNAMTAAQRGEFKARFGHPLELPLSYATSAAAWVAQQSSPSDTGEEAGVEPDRDGDPGSARATSFVAPDTTAPIDGKEASKLHALAHRKPAHDDDRAVDDDTYRILVFASSNGRTDSTKDLSVGEADTLRQAIREARAGRYASNINAITSQWLAWSDSRLQAEVAS